MRKTILFVCLHGSAKSVIAAEHCRRIAAAAATDVDVAAAGVEPDADIPAHVIAGLRADGIDPSLFVPKAVTAEQIERADYVVSFGCELGSRASRMGAQGPVIRWDDIPAVSDDYAAARSAIVNHLRTFVASMA